MIYDCVVIGAGVGGLTSGLSLAKKGKRVLLLDKQPVPGGLATTFRRKGFTFESSLHCVDALGREGEFRQFLKEHDLEPKVDFIELESFCRLIYPRHDFTVSGDRDGLAAALKENFPNEAGNVERLLGYIDKFYLHFDRFCAFPAPMFVRLVLTPLLWPTFIKAFSLTAKDFVEKFTGDEELQGMFTDIWRFIGTPPDRLSLFYFLLVFRGYYYQRTAYVRGGFMKLFQAMADQICGLGSEARFNVAAKTINTRHNRVVSVTTDSGEIIPARAVISNASAPDTLTALIDDEGLKKDYAAKLAALEKSVSAVQVYLGLKVSAKDLGMTDSIYSLNSGYNHSRDFQACLNADYENCALELVDHCRIDPGLAPAGKGSLLIMTLDAYANWQGLNEEEYKNKKETVARTFIKRAQEYLPGLSDNIEVIEVATPRTIERFASLPQGAAYGFSQTVNQAGLLRLAQETKVKGLFLSGAWTFPGAGVHGCVVSGMEAADLALKYLKK